MATRLRCLNTGRSPAGLAGFAARTTAGMFVLAIVASCALVVLGTSAAARRLHRPGR